MNQRGDTIIEVLFAVTVFSMVAVAGLSLMNQGTAMAQRSLEIGLVRDQMDAQADALRYMHSAYIASIGQDGATATDIWNAVSAKEAVRSAQDFDTIVVDQKCQLPQSPIASNSDSDGQPFVIDVRKLDSGSPVLLLNQDDNVNKTATYSKVHYYQDDDDKLPALNPAKPEGLWIQPVYSAGSSGTPGYYDFHIRACWSAPGQATPITLGTIVRLYDPQR